MKVLLGVTGSVAATLTPKLVSALVEKGHEVQVIGTASSLFFFSPQSIRDSGVPVWTDENEWGIYRKGMTVVHIDLRAWAEALLIAPLSANTLAKMANGLCDNLLTCVFRAWDRARPIVVAPAMNTHMWVHPYTAQHLDRISKGADCNVWVVPPVSKVLACGDEGMGAMAPIEEIVKSIPQ